MNVKINSHITANLYYSIVALFYMRHASPVGKCWKNLFVQCIMYYQALNLLYFCTSVLLSYKFSEREYILDNRSCSKGGSA